MRIQRYGVSARAFGAAPPVAGGAPWYTPITDELGVNGRLCVYNEQVTTATLSQVTAWADVRGIPVWTQPGASSLRPLLVADALLFDGVDDRLLADSHASLLAGAHTILIGWSDVDNASTSVRSLLCAANTLSTGTFRQVTINYSFPATPNATRQRYYLADSAGGTSVSLMDVSGLGVGKINMALRSAAPGGSARADQLTSPLTPSGLVITRPSGVETYTWLTLGARRVGATPSLAQFFTGKIRYIAIADSYLSDVQLGTIYATLFARGLL